MQSSTSPLHQTLDAAFSHFTTLATSQIATPWDILARRTFFFWYPHKCASSDRVRIQRSSEPALRLHYVFMHESPLGGEVGGHYGMWRRPYANAISGSNGDAITPLASSPNPCAARVA